MSKRKQAAVWRVIGLNLNTEEEYAPLYFATEAEAREYAVDMQERFSADHYRVERVVEEIKR
jgi:hypothetical protein